MAASLHTAHPRSAAEKRRRRANGFDEPILRLLLNGAPDKAIAARLQVSERTVQRHVRMLLAKVGANNRMQLGQILACRAHRDADASGDANTNGHAPAHAPAHAPTPAQQLPQLQPGPRLGDFDAQVLKLLLQGLPESAIAECLSVSRRTVQRSVKGVMSRVGAANRVQLGWHAQLSGWI